jgi:hypothetical protein
MGYPMQPSYPPDRAGGGTAIPAGLLALLVAIAQGIGLVTTVVRLWPTLDYLPSDIWVQIGAAGVFELLLFLGAILLLARSAAGRWLVIISALVFLVDHLLVALQAEGVIDTLGSGFVLMPVIPVLDVSKDGGMIQLAALGGVLLLVILLTAVPATGRYVAGRQADQAYPGPYSPVTY